MRYLLIFLLSFFVSVSSVAKEYTVLVGNNVASNDGLYMRTFMQATGEKYEIQYMPGAGSRTALDYVLKNSNKEILMLAVLNLPTNMIMTNDPIKVESLKWIGSLSGETAVIVARKGNDKINTLEDLRKPVFFAQSINFTEEIYMLINIRVGTKFEFVKGYNGRAETLLAVQRGEADITNSSTASDGISQYKPIVQVRMGRDSNLSIIPALNEYITDSETKEIFNFLLMPYVTSHPLLLGPNTSQKVVDEYRAMFDRVVAMPSYKKALADAKLSDSAVSGVDLAEIFATYPAGAKLVNKALNR